MASTLMYQTVTVTPRTCPPATADLVDVAFPTPNRWRGGFRTESFHSGSSVTKRISPGSLTGGLT